MPVNGFPADPNPIAALGLRRRDLPHSAIGVVDGETPTVSVNGSTTIASGTTTGLKRIGDVTGADADLAADPTFAVGGTPGLPANAASPSNRIRARVITGGAGSIRYVPTFRFMCDAAEFEALCILPGSTFDYRLSVDGRLAVASTALTPGYSDCKVKFAFTSARPRLIDLTINDPDLIGIRVATGYSIWRPAQGFRRRLVVVGDSLTSGAGIVASAMWCWDLARSLGCDDVWNVGIGGTGWTTDGSGGTSTGRFRARVETDLLPLLGADDVVLIVGSRNDTDAAAITTEVVALLGGGLTKVRQLFVAGTFTSLPQNARVQAGAALANRPFIDASGWITGTGRTGSPNGTGNSDRYIGAGDGTDSVHLSPAGVPFIAKQFRNAMEARLPA